MQAAQVRLDPGKVYRTVELSRWGANPTRLAQRLEREGVVRRLGHGLLHAPKRGRFGEVPPADEEVLTALLDGSPWVITGPSRWNALGLGSTAAFAHTLVYNTKRTGRVEVAGRDFDLRRIAFPLAPPAEWYVVDLLRHADRAGADRGVLEHHLGAALARGRFDISRLEDMAIRFGRRSERELVRRAALAVHVS